MLESGNPYDAHHASGLMFEDVTVKHPVTRVVGDKRDLDLLARRHQHGVLPFAMLRRCAVPGNDPEAMAVQMHRVMPCGRVYHGKNV